MYFIWQPYTEVCVLKFWKYTKNYNAVTLNSQLAPTVITLSQTSSPISYNGPLMGNEHPDDPEYEYLIFKIIIKCKHKIFKFSFWESEIMSSHSPKVSLYHGVSSVFCKETEPLGESACGGQQVQNLQGKPAGWRFKEEFQFKFKGCQLAEFSLLGRPIFF